MAEDDNGKTVEQVAREMIDQYCADAVPLLQERAEQAEAVGDKLAAKVWRDVASHPRH